MRLTDKGSAEDRHVSAAIPSDDDPTSSSGTSSSESDSEEPSDDEDVRISSQSRSNTATTTAASIPNVPRHQKPNIQRMEGGSDLLARLSEFLPKMKDANKSLEKQIAAGHGQDIIMDSVDETDGKDYIEMNLGLGVLEEKGDDADGSSSNEGDDDGHRKSTLGLGLNPNKATAKEDSDVLGKLMGGKESAADKPSIEEIGE